MSETVSSSATDASPTRAAIITVLVIAAVAALIIAVLLFGNDNTPATVDGTTATSSQFID